MLTDEQKKHIEIEKKKLPKTYIASGTALWYSVVREA
jgi:hypothetical protein